MKKLLALALAGAVSMATAAVNKTTFEKMPIFGQIGAKVENFGQVGTTGMYMVQGTDKKSNPFKVVVDEKGEYLFLVQSVIDTKSRTEFKLPIDTTMLKGKESLTYGKGKEVIYVFTDPECPFCKKFELEWPKYEDKYTFKVFLFNLSFHKNAVPMSNYIIAGGSKETRADRLLEIAKGNDEGWKTFNKKLEEDALKEFDKRSKGKSLNERKTLMEEIEKEKQEKLAEVNELLKVATELGNKVGVSGTPTTIKENGDLIDWPKL